MLDWCVVGGRSRRSPTAAGRRSSAASSAPSATAFAGVVSIDLGRTRPGPRGRPGLAGRPHPGRRARARCSRTSSARTATRCATSRSRSSSRRSAAGWPPAPAATTPACTRTSTTSSSRCASSRPTGISESRRLPGSGAGPSPDRLFLGSEGSLGIITEAWMRVQDRPRWRASAGVVFGDYADGVAATRAVAQSALFPTNCRLLDGLEAATAAGTSGVGRAARARLRVGRPSGRAPGSTAPSSCAATTAARSRPGVTHVRQRRRRRRRDRATTPSARGARRSCGRRTCATRWSAAGCCCETFETACTWDAFDELHASVTDDGRATRLRGSAAAAG